MSSLEISDDDDSFERPRRSTRLKKPLQQETISISSEDESDNIVSLSAENFTSDDSFELPEVKLSGTDDRKTQLIEDKRDKVIKNLFPPPQPKQPKLKNKRFTAKAPITPRNEPSTSAPLPEKPPVPSYKKMIGGIQVDFPVPPYGAQIALMSKVIEGISKGVNCLLESPTGSGKTLALLCGALAWQQHEKNRIGNFQVQQSMEQHPELMAFPGVAESIISPRPSANMEELFIKPGFGSRNIYDKPSGSAQQDAGGGGSNGSPFGAKRVESDTDWKMESPQKNLVGIHGKRRKVTSSDSDTPPAPSTPEKADVTVPQPETPKNVRALYDLVTNLRLRTSMFVRSVPTIYYGARTHKQIQQVVKEFSRTVYCGEAKMTVLSSREYSCIREFDRNLYSNKNDMCRECVKKVRVPKLQNPEGHYDTNCKYYENRAELSHDTLPPAFDLEELVSAGRERQACPYYAARLMAPAAQIVFCPYNYLIDPGIRSSLQIQLRDEIVILDEAHNIEDICRDAATFSVSRDQVLAAVSELSNMTEYKLANQDIQEETMQLLKTMKNWDDWFANQAPLIQSRPVNNNEAVFGWTLDFFLSTLTNHNIGLKEYAEFKGNLETFTAKWQQDPSTFYGVTQPSVALMETLLTVFGYMFGEDCKHLEDFKPVLVKSVVTSYDTSPDPRGWRSSQFDKSVQKEVLSLRLLCLSPRVVFSALAAARSVLLGSGTLAPMASLRSELGARFPLAISPAHVIPSNRVWIGTLSTGPNGRPLECKSSATNQVETQDALGQTVLWVSQVTPHGVLCFLPSYQLMNKLATRWRETGLWRRLADAKHVFMESRSVRDHGDVMQEYYSCAASPKGALLLAVYRGKVSEGMDFKDHQARAVVTVGIPYPNTFDMMVSEKMKYNERRLALPAAPSAPSAGLQGPPGPPEEQPLSGGEWLRVQAYRALNQAVGRCVRHRGDWGAVLLVDARYSQPYYTAHLAKWLKGFLGNNHHTFESLVNSPNSLESFMQAMTIQEREEQNM